MSLNDVAAPQWAHLVDPGWIGQNSVSVTFHQHCVAFEQPLRALCTRRPRPPAVHNLATQILEAPDELKAAIILHFSYWPSMINEVLLEMHRRGQKRKREHQQEMQKLRRRLKREEEHNAAPASQTPAVIALPNGPSWPDNHDSGTMAASDSVPPVADIGMMATPRSSSPDVGSDEDVSVTLGSHDTDDFSEMYEKMNAGDNIDGSEDGGHSENSK